MKYEWKKYTEEMRRDGYAVLIFSPEELDGVSPQLVERALRKMFDAVQIIGEISEPSNNTH